MRKLTLLCSLFFLIITTQGQTKRYNNSGLDTLKKDIKPIGNLFKKTGTIVVTINGIDSNDNDFTSLKQNLQRVTGVKKIKDQYDQNKVLLMVSYKGNGAELWQALPQNAKQMFSVLSASDTAINLSYKSAETPTSQRQNNPSSVNQAAAMANEKRPGNVNSIADKQSPALSKSAALLFQNIKTKLSAENKNVMAAGLGFRLSKDGKQFIASEDESAEFPFEAFVYPTDLNKDGKEEIFVLFGNSFTSGMTGTSIVAFIADKNGVYKMNLGFPGTLPDILATSGLGYPDLLIGGPGFEFPVWRWDGKEYNFLKQVKENDLKKMKSTSLEDISKLYTSSVK